MKKISRKPWNDNTKLFYTDAEAAAFIGCSITEVYNQCKALSIGMLGSKLFLTMAQILHIKDRMIIQASKIA